MSQFIALLRGINVGGAKRVPMADLREILEDLGHTRVRTLLNSGNAIFESRRGSTTLHAAQIREAVHQRLGVDVPVIVKTVKDLVAIEHENGLRDVATDPSRLLVAFTSDQQSLQSLNLIAPLVMPPEQFQLGAHAAYAWCANGILDSKVANALLGKRGAEVTTRNWSTVMKIIAAFDPQ